MRLYNRLEDAPVAVYRDVLREEDASGVVPEIVYAAMQQIAGGPVTETYLTVPGHSEAALYIGQEQRRAVSQNQPLFLPPGEHRVVVVTPAGEVHELQLELAGRQRLELEIPETPRPSARLEVDPYGVTVYRGALFEGFTPMDLSLHARPEILRLQREGYRERLLPVSPDVEVITAELPRDTFSLETEVAASRDEFYSALGMFALSVPFWVLSSALVEHMAVLTLEDLSGGAENQLGRWGTAALVSNYAFRGISIGLGIHTAVQLARYIRFAQAEHTGYY